MGGLIGAWETKRRNCPLWNNHLDVNRDQKGCQAQLAQRPATEVPVLYEPEQGSSDWG